MTDAQFKKLLAALKKVAGADDPATAGTKNKKKTKKTAGESEFERQLRQAERSASDEEIKKRKEVLDLENKIAQARKDGVSNEDLRGYLDALDDEKKALEGITKAVQDVKDAKEAGKKTAEAYISSIMGIDGPLSLLGDSLQKNGMVGLAGMASGFRESAQSGQLFVMASLKVIDSLIKFALQTDKVLASFRASTGAGNEFNAVITGIERGAFAAGVTLEDTAGAVIELKNQFTDFTYLNRDQQTELGVTTTLLQKLGIEFGTQATILQTATQSLDMSLTEANEGMLEIASTARALGIDMGVLAESFVENTEYLARFGDNAVDVFNETAVTAKSLGMEVSELLSIMEGFQTFDDAGTKVGRLNAILGGPFLNSMDMLNASFEDPIEGIKLLRDGFDEAGIMAEDLAGAELMAVASALGLTATETKNLLGMSNDELTVQQIKQEELAEAAAKTQDIMTMLNSAFNALMIDMEPLITDFFIPLTEEISKAAQALGNFINSGPGLQTFLATLGTVMGAGIGLMLAFTAVIPGVGPALAIGALAGAGLAASAGAKLGREMGGKGHSAMMNFGPTSRMGTSLGPGASGVGSTPYMPSIPGLASGGSVSATTLAMVGENGPELMEIPGGSHVTSAPSTQQLTDAITRLTKRVDGLGGGGPSQISVYIGREKIDEIVVKAINSPTGRQALSPLTNG